MNLRKRKWLVVGIDQPPQPGGEIFLERLFNRFIDLHASYGHILLQGDFNVIPADLKLRDFCDTHDLENLIKEPT